MGIAVAQEMLLPNAAARQIAEGLGRADASVAGHAWQLQLRRYADPARHDPRLRPVIFVPGYAMNSWILGFHPQGPSMVEWLVQDGFEVWTVNLRGQGDSRGPRRPARYGLAELALDDLPDALAHVRARTASRAEGVDLVGCSLGASLVYALLAHEGGDGVGAVVGLGGPLTWTEVHPLLATAFRSAHVASLVRIRGTRRIARAALPWVRHVPAVLSVYMNARRIDLSRAEDLVNTVDDPVPWINVQLARWVRQRSLVVRGLDVAQALRDVDVPVLAVAANADGIVPVSTALSVADALGGPVDTLVVGEPDRWYAHADLFIGQDAHEDVFEPVRTWLRARQEAA